MDEFKNESPSLPDDTRGDPRRNPCAFKLIELLVVVAIISLVLAVTVPAIQSSREESRRTQCANTLRQFGIALHNYHDVYQRFPIAGIFQELNAGRPNYGEWQTRGSHNARLLPYMASNPNYNLLIDFRMNDMEDKSFDATGRKYLFDRFDVFECPSDDHRGLTQWQHAASNYKVSLGAQNMGDLGWSPQCLMDTIVGPSPWTGANHEGNWFGDGPAQHSSEGFASTSSGPFTRVARSSWTGKSSAWSATFGDISDGTANVIVMGEVRVNCSDHNMHSWLHANGSWTGSTTAPINFNTCLNETRNAGGWGAGPEGPRNHIWSWPTSLGFKSRHPGGAQVLMCDATVHFLSEAISYETYQRLGSRRDGHAVTVPP